MKCSELANKVSILQPEADPRDVARFCLLLTNAVDTVDALVDEDRLSETWQEVGLRLQAATDQHAAMTEELESLARSDPSRFASQRPNSLSILSTSCFALVSFIFFLARSSAAQPN